MGNAQKLQLVTSNIFYRTEIKNISLVLHTAPSFQYPVYQIMFVVMHFSYIGIICIPSFIKILACSVADHSYTHTHRKYVSYYGCCSWL